MKLFSCLLYFRHILSPDPFWCWHSTLNGISLTLTNNRMYKSETTINYLFKQSLSTVSALPFHYLNDLWRWKAFRGDFPDRLSWNDEFWKLAEEVVGVHAPVERTLEDLDCPAIYHVAQDYDMIRYFTRTILQFQFAESLCETAGHEGPLNECDVRTIEMEQYKVSPGIKNSNSNNV